MATYNVGPVTANQTVTQNVAPGDTVVVTVQGPGPFDGASATTQINIGSVSKTTNREYTLSNFTAGTTYTFSTDDDDAEPYTVTGTVSSSSTTDYFVDLTASIEEEFNTTSIVAGLSGTGAALSSSNPLQLNPGDRVGFRKIVTGFGGGAAPSNTAIASGFNSLHWTNTNNIALGSTYTFKTAKTGISISVTDVVTVTITSTNNTSFSDNTHYIGTSLQPDTSIVVGNDNLEISTSATSFTQSIANKSGTSTDNSTITEYRIKDSSTSHESRVGYGNITVTDVPPNPGFPKNYSVEARVTTANGGSGVFKDCPNTIFSVLATTTAASNDPTLDNYGVAIYDDQSNLVSSFTSGHTVLRKIFSTSSPVTLSTTTHTDIDTGLTGITTSNSVIALEGANTTTQNASGSVRLPATFITGGNGNTNIRVGRVTSARSINAEVLQHVGATIGASSTNYGMIIRNGDNETIIDENSEVFSVREIIDVNTSLSSQTLFEGERANFVYVELTQGRYPGAEGPPVPALSCTQSVLLIPPLLYAIKHTDGSYKTVLLTIPKPTSTSLFKLAMLVPGSSSPEYYGGSASDYGLEFKNSSGTTIWRSDYRQAIVNNVIAANQFTTGTNQNGNYDVTTGYDGVQAPTSTTAESELALDSIDSFKTISSLNEMDPANSYVSGALTAMFVDYYKGRLLSPEFNIDEPRGGGQHLVGLRINNTTTVTLGTFRYREGSTNTSAYGQRNPNSYHPEGHFVVFRIV